MVIPLVSADEIRTGRGGGKGKGKRYGKYAKAIAPHVQWFKDSIDESSDKAILVKVADIKNELGGEFVKKNDVSIYWALKYVLFSEGIVVDTSTHEDGGKLLAMRHGTEDDRLPPSLSNIGADDEGEFLGEESSEEESPEE